MSAIRARNRVLAGLGILAFLMIAFHSAAESATGGPPGERTLHFPGDASLGAVLVCDWETTRSYTSYKPLAEARGDIRVPAGKAVFLSVVDVDPKPPSLVALTALKPDDLQYIAFQTMVTNDNLASLKGLTGLQQLYVNFALFGDEALANLSGMTSLRELRIRPVGGNFSGVGFSHLGKLPALRRLDFSRANLTEDGLAAIAKLTTLEELSLGLVNISESGMARLRDLPSLRTLHLKSARIPDAALAQLADLPKLEELSLLGSRFSGERLGALSRLRSLRTLSLQRTMVGDADLAQLAGLTNLQSLDLAQTLVTDAGLSHLKALSSLKSLDLSGSRVAAARADLQKTFPSVDNIVTGGQASAASFSSRYGYSVNAPGGPPSPLYPPGAPPGARMVPYSGGPRLTLGPSPLTSLRPRAETTITLNFEAVRKEFENPTVFAGTVKTEEGTVGPGQFGPGRGMHIVLRSKSPGPQGPTYQEIHIWFMDPRYDPLLDRAPCDPSSRTFYLGRADDYQVFFRSEEISRGPRPDSAAGGFLNTVLHLDQRLHLDLICQALEGTDPDLKRAAVDDLYLFEAHTEPSAMQYQMALMARAIPVFERMMQTADPPLRKHVATLYREDDVLAAISRIRTLGGGPGRPAPRGVIAESVKNRPDLTEGVYRYYVSDANRIEESGYGWSYGAAALLRIMAPPSSDTLRLVLKARRRTDLSQADEILGIALNQAVKSRCPGLGYELARCLWNRNEPFRKDALEYFRQVRDESVAPDLFKAIEEASASSSYEKPETVLQQLFLGSSGAYPGGGVPLTGGVTQLIESGYPWRANLDAICSLPVSESFRKTLRETIRRQEPLPQMYSVDKQFILTVLALNFLILNPDPEALPDLLPLLALGGGPPVAMAGTAESSDSLFAAVAFNRSHTPCHYAARAVVALGPKAASPVWDYLKRELDRRFSSRRSFPDGTPYPTSYNSQRDGDLAYCLLILGILGDERVAAESLNPRQGFPNELQRARAIACAWFRQGGREFQPPRAPLRPPAKPASIPPASISPFMPFPPYGYARAKAELKKLDLTRREIAEDELPCIGQMTWLRELYLASCGIGDNELAKIRPPASLEVLDLSRNRITDAAIAHLAPLKGLQILDLGSTTVSDASIAQLMQLTTLRLLYLGDTQITRAGATELRKALPQCEIWK